MQTINNKSVKQNQKDHQPRQQKHQQQKTQQLQGSKKPNQNSSVIHEHEHVEMRMTD